MSKGKARIFVPLTKVDEEQRLVYGRITQDVLDKSGEQMDYATSKPLFEAWSEGISKATDGKSKGNVRVMHGLNACGKLTELEFDDDDQAIDVCAKIVDDQEWNKVTEGVYTGFSVGGSYEKKWSEKVDGVSVKKYTAKPMEVSIVDNPCVPTATFSMMKADGAVEEVPFQVEHDSEEWPEVETVQKAAEAPAEEPRTAAESAVIGDPALAGPQPSNDEVATKATELAKAAGHDRWVEFVEEARAELMKGDPTSTARSAADPTAGGHNPLDEDQTAKKPALPKTKAKPSTTTLSGKGPGDTPGTTGADNPANKVTPPGIKQQWTASDGTAFDKKAEAEAHEQTLLEKADQRDEGDEDPAKPEGEVEEKKPSDEEKVTEQKDLPLADQLKAALTTVGETLAKAEAARTEGDEEQLPLLADFDRMAKAVTFIEDDASDVLNKASIYSVSLFAEVLSSMANLVSSVKAHSDEDSGLPDEVKAAVTSLSSTFQTFATEQVAKLVANLDDPKGCDYYYCAASADDADGLAKDVGALIEAVAEPAAAIKESFVKAAPGPDDEDEDGEEDENPEVNDLKKVTAERDDLAKAIQAALPEIADLRKRLETVENTPLPRAPRNIVEKDGGNGLLKGTTDTERLAEVAELVNTMGPDALATMMIKASQATGGQRLNPVG